MFIAGPTLTSLIIPLKGHREREREKKRDFLFQFLPSCKEWNLLISFIEVASRRTELEMLFRRISVGKGNSLFETTIR